MRARLAVPLAAVLIAASLAGAAVLIVGNTNANDDVHGTGVRLTAGETRGRELFARQCSFCHTLAAANATGRTGPNLDLLAPSGLPAAFVLTTIEHGVDVGDGNMPAGLYSGDDARDVADFVAAVTRAR
jgi:mono/diheme cytochrome c family protein